MKTIHKFPILHGIVLIPIHKGCKPLAFQMQRGLMTLWAEVETTNEVVNHEFQVFGTGHQVRDDMEYIGTAQQDSLVWHLYWVKP